jgi:hypothetical protein
MKFFIPLLLLITCLSVNAQDYYVGADFGNKDHELDVTLISSTLGKQDESTFTVTLGSNINNKLSVEASYIDFGNATVNSAGQQSQFTWNGYTYMSQAGVDDQTNPKYEINAFLIGGKYNAYSDTTRLGSGNVYVVGGLTFWDREFGTAGYTRYGQGVSINDRITIGNENDSGITAYYGIGYDWTIGDRINLSVDCIRYDIDGDTNPNISMGISILSF